METNILNISNLSVKYDKNLVLNALNLTLLKGKYYCLIGNNGSGKSTLLKTIVGLINNENGEILFDGYNITNLKTYEIINLGISYVSQSNAIYPRLKVKDHFELAAKGRPYNLDKLVEYFPEIINLKNKIAGTLSGGEQRLLALSLVILQPDKKLIILDEILAGVDKKIKKSMLNILNSFITNDKKTIFMVEQNEDFIKNFKGTIINIENLKENTNEN